MTQLENNIRLAQERALEMADSEFLDVGEDGYEDEFSLEPLDMERPGEDEWDPDRDTSSSATLKKPKVKQPTTPKVKGKRGRPSKSEFKS